MSFEERKQQFLARTKSQGRSSPAGIHWQRFFELLKQHQRDGDGIKLPVPLILAASGESDRSKHQRLSDQLDWAIANGCFDEAIEFLENLDENKWNSGPAEAWEREFY